MCLQAQVEEKPVVGKKGTDTLQSRIVLIGDAGSLVEGKASVLNSMKQHFKFDDKTTVIFLGDNLYDYGLPDETYQRYNDIKAALDSQINLIRGTQAKSIMIPGNHDWANGKAEGLENVRRQQQYVDRYAAYNLSFLPKDGCPGPEEVKISKDVTLIVMDSQWWLHLEEKTGIESDCSTKNEEEVIEELKEIVNKNYDKLVIIAMHHPFKSNGPHGRYFSLKQHIFPFTDMNKKLYIPLPIIGSIYPITRSVFGSSQDIPNPRYQNMINMVMGAVKQHPNVVFVSGHEHNLQYIKDSSYHYIVSGSGCKTNRVSLGRNSIFAKESLGFATLEISVNKDVNLNFFSVDETRKDSLTQNFESHILNFKTLPKPEVKDTVTAQYVYKDFVRVPASNKYKRLNGLKKLVNGSNYRKEWSEPVEMKVFNITKEKGGFTIEGMGGGNQTKSLKLVDKAGNMWSLRTVDKDPEKVIPESFRNTVASNVVRDMISASNPYAPLVITPIASSVGIITSNTQFFFVPDDPNLGYYKNYFSNKVCLLEPRDPNYADDNKSTFKMMDKMREDNDHTVDQSKVLTARLLDMLIGDWDRHFDQWRWGTKDTGQGKTYYPMPKDRDQAFFRSNGLLTKFIHGQMPFLEGFTSGINKMSKFNMVAKDFDRIFLNQITQNQWDSITNQFIANLTDETLQEAVKALPPEIYNIRGKKITQKLIGRRDQLKSASQAYYKFLSQEIRILGSNKSELYKFNNTSEGGLELTGYQLKRDEGDSSFVLYHRIFKPGETKEIQIYGFNGDDRFEIAEGTSSTIKLRFIGGKGSDTFDIKGHVRTHIYDQSGADSNYQKGNKRFRTHFGTDVGLNRFELKAYKYKQVSFPKLTMGYNVDDGLLLGVGFIVRNYKFRKDPFASEHRFSALSALTQKAFQVKYSAVWNKLLGNTDVYFDGKLNMPGITNFYGLGNTTKQVYGKRFYMARYKTVEAQLLFSKSKFDGKINLFMGPTLFHYWNRYENNQKFVFGNPSLVGLDSAAVYSPKTFVGLKAGINLKKINSEMVPTNGIQWSNVVSVEKGVSGAKNLVTKFTSDMTVYASTKLPAKVTAVIRLGYSKMFNSKDSAQFFQYLYLGQNNNLRGFRKNRYGGSELLYGGLEFRIKLGENRNYLLPGQFGIITFGDIGRVWYKKDIDNNRWHTAYGGGFYYIPFNTALISATIGKNEDPVSVLNISIGAKFNLTF